MESIVKELDKFKTKKVLVIGDLMLDKYVYGKVSRISPEAPIPVMQYTSEKHVPGGAANVANNIATLGSQVFLSGVVGIDSNKSILIEELSKRGINTAAIVTDETRPTTLKQRIVSGNNQLLRVDHEQTAFINPKVQAELLKQISEIMPEMDIIILSDYYKGVISKELSQSIISLARRNNKKIIADGKPKNIEAFKNVDLFTPNLKEAKEITGIEDDVKEMGKKIIRMICANVLITRGSDGMTIFEKTGDIKHIPTKPVQVFDVSGAGDTTIAAIALAMTLDMPLPLAAYIANSAGRLAVQKVGTVTITLNELKESLSSSMVNAIRKKYDKVWGQEDWIVNYENSNYCGKKLILNKGFQCSIHYHKVKSEVFYINKGLVLIQAYDTDKLMKPGDSLLIEPGTKHRFIGLTDSEIIEFSSHHKDEDSYRDEPSGKVDDEKFSEYIKKYGGEIDD